MKKALFLSFLLLNGCNSFRRLTEGEEHPPINIKIAPTSIPDFGLPIIVGYKQTEYEGWVDNGNLQLAPNCKYLSVHVFFEGQWTKLTLASGRMGYDEGSGVFKFVGINPNTYYVVYQWVPK